MPTYKTKLEHAKYFQGIARTEWFKNHEVIEHTLVDDETGSMSIKVVDFCRPNTNVYAVRYIFAGHYVYVSGDLGTAVFNCTWRTRPTDKSWQSTWYIFEKLSASEGSKEDYDDEVCVETIKHMLLDTDQNGNHTRKPESWDRSDRDTFDALIGAARSVSSTEEWVHKISEIEEYHRIGRLDGEYWEWLYSAGNVMQTRIVGIIVKA